MYKLKVHIVYKIFFLIISLFGFSVIAYEEFISYKDLLLYVFFWLIASIFILNLFKSHIIVKNDKFFILNSLATKWGLRSHENFSESDISTIVVGNLDFILNYLKKELREDKVEQLNNFNSMVHRSDVIMGNNSYFIYFLLVDGQTYLVTSFIPFQDIKGFINFINNKGIKIVSQIDS